MAIHGGALRVRDLLIARTFELWTHENDIRAAAGLASSVRDPRRRGRRPSSRPLLPSGAAFTDLREPISVHLVLTGPGGGTWDVVVGEPAPVPAPLGIVTGDPRQATSVLTAAAALALD